MVEVAKCVEEILHGNGFVLVSDVISPAQATEARERILERAADERQAGTLFTYGQRDRLYNLICKGKLFEELVQHPTVLSILEAILGEDMTLGGFSAHIVNPGAVPMGAHVDYPYFSLPEPYPISPTLEVQVIWMLEEFTEANGATAFVAGSQTWGTFPEPSQFTELAKPLIGRAGSVAISHGLCWHDTAANTTNTPRVAILGNYNPKYIRPLENPVATASSELIENASPKLKQLLGMTFQESLLNDVMQRRSQLSPSSL